MTEQTRPPIWRYEPLDAYDVPLAPAAARMRGTLRELWNRVRGADDLPVESAALARPSRDVLDALIPPPSWDAAVPALEAALGEWASGAGEVDDNVRVVVGAPGAAGDGVLAAWCAARDWRSSAAPDVEEILNGGAAWVESFAAHAGPCAVLRIDELYLRHHDGLALVERLLDHLVKRRQRVVVGCGSWSWAYLTRSVGVDVVMGSPIALQAFDARRLRDWFGDLGSGAVTFCHAGEDATEILVGEPCEGDDEPAFLRLLATKCRGIPRVAWAAWRESVRLSGQERAAGDSIWLSDEPSVTAAPSRLTPCDLAVLHESLLQGATTAGLLARLLPYSAAEVTNSLHLLGRSGLMERRESAWRVACLGYPAARSCLADAGYAAGAI